MHWGFWCDSSAYADRIPRGFFEVNNESDKIVQGDKEHSELEVRGEPGLQS